MSLTTSEMTPADIAAVTNNNGNNCNDGWGGGWSSWIILFLIFGMFGWGGFGGFGGGWGGNNAGVQGALTRGELCQDMNFSQLENGVRGIQQGLCDGFYAQNTAIMNGFHGVDNAVCQLGYQTQQGFHGVDNAICNLGYQTQQGFNQTNIALMQGQNALQSQLADCCCQTQRAIDSVNYNMASNTCAIQNSMCNNTRDIIDSQNNGTRAILDALTAQRIEAKDQRIAEQAQTIAQLQLSASQSAQNAVLMAAMDANTANIIRRTGNDCPVNAYVVQPPTPVSFPTNCYGQATFSNNGGCGNSGCC
ncbi:MAG: hypothetical protein K2K16_12970 [Ruminococcus sp.]|nr:hypothetical protein [Ruminococcus sp.]